MKKLVLATGNWAKASELYDLLQDLPLEILTLREYPGLVMPEEDQPTFSGNAVKKAKTVARITGEMALADDSGLEVDALEGRPGVRSSRYAGEEGDYAENNRKLLEELKGVPPDNRSARFVCAVAVAVPENQAYIIEESCPGRIAESLQGEKGFGYDPLFIYEPAGITFAEMSPEEKNRVSHRGRALRRTRVLLERLLLGEDAGR